MDTNLSIFVTLVVIIFCLVLAYVVYNIIDNNTNNKYKNLPFHSYYSGKSKHMKKCPNGCIRGRCDYNKYCRDHFPPYPKCCAFDFQCNYCKDVDTGLYYIQPGYDDNIENKYNKQMNESQTEIMNRDIKNNNQYINRINRKIKNINIDNGYS